MSPQAKKEYMEKIYLRYKRAKSRNEKSLHITELCLTCAWHRKHAIRALKNFRRFAKPKPKKRGRPSIGEHYKCFPRITQMLLHLYASRHR